MHRSFTLSSILALAMLALMSFQAQAFYNLLTDPGFERYHYDYTKGTYVPDDDAAWKEVGFGQSSVNYDSGNWTAPPEMLRERPQGFSPSARGFVGTGPDQNSGQMIFQQDFTDQLVFRNVKRYEAWVWLGGSGADDETGDDYKDEIGGWRVYFYSNSNTSTWTADNALEVHESQFNYWGEPNSFVQISGFGDIPANTVGIRMECFASTWNPEVRPLAYNTRVALDNAHFAVINKTNLLANPDFEKDTTPATFVGWQFPASYPFSPNTYTPIDIRNVYGSNIDHGTFLPYFGDWRAYGYATYLNGWIEDSFSLSQTVNWNELPGTSALATCYWLQDVNDPVKAYRMRDIGSSLEFVVRYLDGTTELGIDKRYAEWPVSSNEANRCITDQNGGLAYNPRFILDPPGGTNRIEFNVHVPIHMFPAEDKPHVSFAVDEFYFGSSGFRDIQESNPTFLVR